MGRHVGLDTKIFIDVRMITEWMRRHVNPDLVTRYEREMRKIRGEESNLEHIVTNTYNLYQESEKSQVEFELRENLLNRL